MDYIWFEDDDIITNEPGLMPDILVPVSEQNNYYAAVKYGNALWVNVKLPEDVGAGEYDIKVFFGEDCASVTLEVVDEVLSKNTFK